jgi:hypothetical protein
VNRVLPRTVATCFTREESSNPTAYCGISRRPNHHTERAWGAFPQILGKSYFFKLIENLQRILFDYEPKRSRRANPAFKGPC